MCKPWKFCLCWWKKCMNYRSLTSSCSRFLWTCWTVAPCFVPHEETVLAQTLIHLCIFSDIIMTACFVEVSYEFQALWSVNPCEWKLYVHSVHLFHMYRSWIRYEIYTSLALLVQLITGWRVNLHKSVNTEFWKCYCLPADRPPSLSLQVSGANILTIWKSIIHEGCKVMMLSKNVALHFLFKWHELYYNTFVGPLENEWSVKLGTINLRHHYY